MADALTGWHEAAVKATTVDFVARITTAGGTYCVPPADRIAPLDNDGTV